MLLLPVGYGLLSWTRVTPLCLSSGGTAMPRPGPSGRVSYCLPRAATLRRYGLTVEDWLEILNRQGGVCAVCGKTPRTGRFNTDHDHVRGWKRMPPERRKLHVRGLLCHFCNHYYMGRCITVAKAEAVAEYLRQHQQRLERATQ